MKRSQLDMLLRRLAQAADKPDLTLDWQAGRSRVQEGENRYLSPRLTNADMALWLDAAFEGVQMSIDIETEEARNEGR